MEVREIIAEVARAKNDLASIQSDTDESPDRLTRCLYAVADLETGVAELLTEDWIPRTVPELTASIYCVRENLRCLQSEIDDALDVSQCPNIFERAMPDELFRVWMGMAFGRLLVHQLDILVDALALATPKAEWTN